MVGRLVIKDNKMNNENTLSTKSAQFFNEMKGGHTATQNRTRKNTRRSHTLQVRITQGLKGPAEDRLQPLVVFHLLSVVRPWWQQRSWRTR